MLTTADANGNVTTYTYGDAWRRSTVTDALSQITTFGYDAANRRIKVGYPDGKVESTAASLLSPSPSFLSR